jgi:hypothetical protein
MTIKLDGKLPPEADRNGLEALHRRLMAEPHQLCAVIMLVDRRSFEHDDDGDADVPKARVRAIEAVTAGDLHFARQIMDRSRAERLGRLQLPFGMEEEVRAAFDLGTASGATLTRGTPAGDGPPPWTDAEFAGVCAGDSCGLEIHPGDRIQSDGSGGWLCGDCGTGDDDE